MEGAKELHGKQLQQQTQGKQDRKRQGLVVGRSAGQLQGKQQPLQKGKGRLQQEQQGKYNEQQQEAKQDEQQQQPLAQMGPAGLRLCSATSASGPLPRLVEKHQQLGFQEQAMPRTGSNLLATQTQYKVHQQQQQQQQPQEPYEEQLQRASQEQAHVAGLQHSLQREQQQQHCLERQHVLQQQQQCLDQQQRLQQHGLQQQQQRLDRQQRSEQQEREHGLQQQQQHGLGQLEQLHELLQQQRQQRLEQQERQHGFQQQQQQQQLATARLDHGLQQHHLQQQQQQQQETHVLQTVTEHCWDSQSLQQKEDGGRKQQWGQACLHQNYQQQKQWQQPEEVEQHRQQQPQRRKPQSWTEQLKQWQEFQEAQQSKEQQQQHQQEGEIPGVMRQSYQSLLHGTEDYHLQRQIPSEPRLETQQASMTFQDRPRCARASDQLLEVDVHGQLLPHSQPMPAGIGATVLDLDHLILPPSSHDLQFAVRDAHALDLEGGLGSHDILVDIFHQGQGFQEQHGGLSEHSKSMQQQQQLLQQQRQDEGQVVAHPLPMPYLCNQEQQRQQLQQCQQFPVSRQQQQQQHVSAGLQYQQQELGTSLLLPPPPLMLPELGALSHPPSHHDTPEQFQPQLQL